MTLLRTVFWLFASSGAFSKRKHNNNADRGGCSSRRTHFIRSTKKDYYNKKKKHTEERTDRTSGREEARDDRMPGGRRLQTARDECARETYVIIL